MLMPDISNSGWESLVLNEDCIEGYTVRHMEDRADFRG
jgi:hypothetical protein